VTVPKATSYLDYRLVFTQGHIGPSRQVINVKAVAESPSMNSPSNSEFRTGSSTRVELHLKHGLEVLVLVEVFNQAAW